MILVSGGIPADRSAPTWRAGFLALLDKRAAELRQFPSPLSLWRTALRSDRPKSFSPIDPGLFNAPFCSGNALCPRARALFWTEPLQEPCCAPVELGHRLINQRGPDVLEPGP